MKRRALLKGLVAVGVPAAAAAATSVASRSKQVVRETTDQSIETLRAQFRDLRERFERTDKSNRRIARAALALAALSLGLDVTSVL